MSLRWWEGPQWLTVPPNFWQHGNILSEDVIEDQIGKEKLKSTESLANIENIIQCDRKFKLLQIPTNSLFSMLDITIKNNCLCTKEERTRGELTSSEFKNAELKLVLMIQQENFEGEDDKKFKGLAVFVDEDKILRVKTRILNRRDKVDFQNPTLLTSNLRKMRL
ncbi:hypothetical protein AVEN_98702-1 [Araneus ventricosus]|uniref:DUF5641 domain-containing protein n=1 Tax=Araneus ventricosus TaxID=182803 RepID=A0A4Y2N3K3_ARAVE|nr:hypothetical protein AVEN_98702-1 [Araneus ventricosus]